MAENYATSKKNDFSKYENLAKQKFLESLSNNNLKKKDSLITKKFDSENLRNNKNENEFLKNLTNNLNENSNFYEKNVESNANQYFKEEKILKKEKNSFTNNNEFDNKNYNQYKNNENKSQFEKFYDWLKEKWINIKNNQNARNYVNPFRNDEDPSGRYCYYTISGICCFLYLIILVLIMSAN